MDDGRSMETAPRDGTKILAWCDHEADPYYEDDGVPDGPARLTLYAAHAEGMCHAPTGFHIIEWGGAYDDGTWEYPDQGSLPDWWFVAGSEYEVAANPTRWWPLPARQKDTTND